VAYPSPVLYTAALIDARGDRLPALDQFLKSRVAAECAGSQAPASGWPKRRSPHAALQFVIGANAGDAAGKEAMSDGKRVPLFRELGAWTLVRVANGQIEPAKEVDEAPFRNRVVLIGATHADARDFYATPLGTQSGVMILANAVAGAHAMVEAPELSPFAESVIAIVLFVLFAAIGSRLQLVVTAIIVGVISGIAVMTLAREIGFDSAIRIIALALTLLTLQHLIKAVVGIVVSWRNGLGWRALLVQKSGH
jgi:hypothetical protein